MIVIVFFFLLHLLGQLTASSAALQVWTCTTPSISSLEALSPAKRARGGVNGRGGMASVSQLDQEVGQYQNQF